MRWKKDQPAGAVRAGCSCSPTCFSRRSGVPVPAIPTLIVAGALVQQGQTVLPRWCWRTAVAASLLGDVAVVRCRPDATATAYCDTLCRVAIEPDSCVKQTENIFERWGAPSLVFAKFVPGFSIVAPPHRGRDASWRLVPFFVYSAMGAAVWAGVAIARGRDLPRPGGRCAPVARRHGVAGGGRHRRCSLSCTSRSNGSSAGFSIRWLRMVRINRG